MLAEAGANTAVAQTDVYARDIAKADTEADAVVAANLPGSH
jgi:membrane fusion protein (multidrug efflux system)